jgi:hypothetical protein
MVGDHEKIERADELHRLAGVGDDLLASREPIPCVNIERSAHEAGVEGKIGVEMSVAEQNLVRIGAAYIRRIDFLLLEILNLDRAVLRRGCYGARAYSQTGSS